MDTILNIIFNSLNTLLNILDNKMGFKFLEKRERKEKIKRIIKLLKYYKKNKNQEMVQLLEDRLAELVFLEETGIRTNAKTIIKYHNFITKLGENYTYKDVRIIKEYLVFDKEEIEIKVSKLTFWSASILYFLLLILVVLFALTIQDIIPKMGIDIKSIISYFLILFFFIFIWSLMIKGVIPPIYANGIRKKLEKRENSKDKNKPTVASNT